MQNNERVILGIHSNVAGSAHTFTSGHAWITVTRGSQVTAYGLWPDEHPRTVDNGDQTDIRVGLEGTRFPKASRFYHLTSLQTLKLEQVLKRNVTWRYTNTCASWASELIEEIVGVDIDADDWAGFETPRELGEHILELETRSPTSRTNPALYRPKRSSLR